MCAAINKDTLYYYEAQEVSYNSDRFIDFLNGLFLYLERDGRSGVTLVTENVRFHHVGTVADLTAESLHRSLFLPPYSPFLNQIENLFNQ